MCTGPKFFWWIFKLVFPLTSGVHLYMFCDGMWPTKWDLNWYINYYSLPSPFSSTKSWLEEVQKNHLFSFRVMWDQEILKIEILDQLIMCRVVYIFLEILFIIYISNLLKYCVCTSKIQIACFYKHLTKTCGQSFVNKFFCGLSERRDKQDSFNKTSKAKRGTGLTY